MSTVSDSTVPSTSRGGLPSSAYNGSHLSINSFRQNVLAPYRIRIYDVPSHRALPASLIQLIETSSRNLSRFDAQLNAFRQQATALVEVSSAHLLPPTLLPLMEHEPQLSRCATPSFSRQALPERSIEYPNSQYVLSVPHASLACGFDESAFTHAEALSIPQWMTCRGTLEQGKAENASPMTSTIYAPFLTFEHAYGPQTTRIDAANNQCAINGSWCIRALQMCYAKAYSKEQMPAAPRVFSCSLDNEVAIINYHWVDKYQNYSMSPVCRFELLKDDHFQLFVAWIEAIETWALMELLPQLKAAIAVVSRSSLPFPTPSSYDPNVTAVFIGSERQKRTLMVNTLKTKFEDIPWLTGDGSDTTNASSVSSLGVCSSSIASWGSPLAADFSPAKYPPVPLFESKNIKSLDNSCSEPLNTPKALPQTDFQPAYTKNIELVWQKRFDHAMDEILSLQTHFRDLERESSAIKESLQEEISELRHEIETFKSETVVEGRHREMFWPDSCEIESLEPVHFHHQLVEEYSVLPAPPYPTTPALPQEQQTPLGSIQRPTNILDTFKFPTYLPRPNLIPRPVSEPRPICPVKRSLNSPFHKARRSQDSLAFRTDTPMTIDVKLANTPVLPTSPLYPPKHIIDSYAIDRKSPATVATRDSPQRLESPHAKIMVLPYTPAPHKISFFVPEDEDEEGDGELDGILVVPPTPWITTSTLVDEESQNEFEYEDSNEDEDQDQDEDEAVTYIREKIELVHTADSDCISTRQAATAPTTEAASTSPKPKLKPSIGSQASSPNPVPISPQAHKLKLPQTPSTTKQTQTQLDLPCAAMVLGILTAWCGLIVLRG